MTRARVAWTLCALDVVVIMVVQMATPNTELFAVALFVLGVASYTGIGAVLVDRVPANPVGPLLSIIGTLVVATVTLTQYAAVGARQTPQWPAVESIRVLSDAFFIIPVVLAVVGVPLVFPDGRLPSRRYRWVVAAVVVGLTSWLLGATVGLDLGPVVLVTLPVSMIGGAVAIVGRFRSGDPLLRAQVKWLAAIVVVAAISVLAGLLAVEALPVLGSAFTIVGVLALALMPLAIGVAILRYRLYEIDRIVSRTISYGAVTAILAVVFVATIIAVQAALSHVTSGQTIPVAVSTLVVFALFQPIRRRVQRLVDRRFDRARYDGERTALAFAERLRNEVDIATVNEELDRTVRDVLRPSAVMLWLRNSDPAPQSWMKRGTDG